MPFKKTRRGQYEISFACTGRRPDGDRCDGRAARRLAGVVVGHLLGGSPARLKPLGGGLTNFVFEARHAEGEFVVRLGGHPGKIKDFLKEQWAMARARDAGIPVSEGP